MESAGRRPSIPTARRLLSNSNAPDAPAYTTLTCTRALSGLGGCRDHELHIIDLDGIISAPDMLDPLACPPITTTLPNPIFR